MRLYGIRAGKFAIEPGPILFCGGLWVLPRTLLYCTENVAGIHACIRGRGQGSPDPPENRRNKVFPRNAGSVKTHKVANLAFNVGPPSGLPANPMAFRWWPDVVTLTLSPIKEVKVGPLSQNIMPPHKY